MEADLVVTGLGGPCISGPGLLPVPSPLPCSAFSQWTDHPRRKFQKDLLSQSLMGKCPAKWRTGAFQGGQLRAAGKKGWPEWEEKLLSGAGLRAERLGGRPSLRAEDRQAGSIGGNQRLAEKGRERRVMSPSLQLLWKPVSSQRDSEWKMQLVPW